MQYGPTATKELGAAGKASAEFIKAKGLDVANKVLTDPKWYERTRDFVIGALGPEGPASSASEAIGGAVGDVVKSVAKDVEKAVSND